MSVKETLVKARDILIERGVERGGWYINDNECQVCSLGAISLAAGGKVEVYEFIEQEFDAELNEDVEVITKDVQIGGADYALTRPAQELLEQVIHPSRPADQMHTSIPLWNDHTQTDAEVIEAFDRAIALADN